MNQTQLFGLYSHSDQPRHITFLRKDCYPNAKYVKGYVYLNSEPHDIVVSLDDGYRDLPAGSRLYKKIENYWYIYLEHQSYEERNAAAIFMFVCLVVSAVSARSTDDESIAKTVLSTL